MKHWICLVVVLMAVLVACQNNEPEIDTPATSPAPTAEPTLPSTNTEPNESFIVIATDAPNPPFTDFDRFGNVVGYLSNVAETVAGTADLEYEFVVTPFEGLLSTVAENPRGDLDVVMVPAPIPTAVPEGISYTQPYLELGQMLVVLADEEELTAVSAIQPGQKIGVTANSSSEQAARELLQISEADLVNNFATNVDVFTALVAEELDGIIVDNYTAEHFTNQFPDQLKIAGETGRAGWISSKRYGLAVASENEELLAKLNEAIQQATTTQSLQQIASSWFVPSETFDPGESRVGTTADIFVLGILGQLTDLDPASNPDLLSWEVKNNIMSGLYRLEDGIGPVPHLIMGAPEISEDKLTYTFSLRADALFANGRSLSADDVKWSINRSARLGNFLVNSYLKDSNDDSFADEDAVQVVDAQTVRILLQEPTAYLPNLLATPPFFPIDSGCYSEAVDLSSLCGGIGPYAITSWTVEDGLRLQANDNWLGDTPTSETVQLLFFDEAATLRRALERFQSVDMALNAYSYEESVGLTQLDGTDSVDFASWEGPTLFKSYLVFEQSQSPWDVKQVRQAAAYALDREQLASLFGGSRRPLLSPIPDHIPAHLAVYPPRDLDRARALLLEAGYSADRPLAIALTYENNGRYSSAEADYANAIKAQLEETGVFQVTLEGVIWESFRAQIAQCDYAAYLIGWPTPGQTTNYMDATSWTDFFVENTSSGFCSNYESDEMTRLLGEANGATDPAARAAFYTQIQQLWANELPTLDLLQEPRRLVSLASVENVAFDLLGLLQYGTLTKKPAGE
ncbi:MAG: ABC transporter substrate-binding protein [Chloroflexota bacterium]